MLNDVAILITTFERPRMCLKCVKSIRKYYPDIRIMVSDNGKRRLWFQYLLEKLFSVDYLKLPFDSGLSKSRNEALRRISEDFVVICDDDFGFTPETKLEIFHKILSRDSRIGLVAGNLRYGDYIRDFTNEIKFHRGFYWVDPIREPKWLYFDGIKYHYSDYVYNFFMMRNIPDFHWDDDYKIGREHIDFFIRLKQDDKWKAAYTPDIIANHWHKLPKGRYKKYRERMDSFSLFYKKTGHRLNFSQIMVQVYDEIEDRFMPYPEYIWKRMVENKK
ncbi:MAG: glycosyltransferase [Candidatus Aminicenantes bacterium]|nr:glycosyltransferase [Candidatus Aminicenantes bacterium]